MAYRNVEVASGGGMRYEPWLEASQALALALKVVLFDATGSPLFNEHGMADFCTFSDGYVSPVSSALAAPTPVLPPRRELRVNERLQRSA